jgi:DNA-binding NarL/FixJ family response regulator
MSAEQPVRVLVVDDHDLFRTGSRALLEELGFEVADSASGAVAIRRVGLLAPHVVVMDMTMPSMSGIEATPAALEAAPDTSGLMLTIATDDSRVVDALRAGGSGYLLRNAELGGIVAGIRAAAAGHSAIAPPVAGKLVDTVRSVTPRSRQRRRRRRRLRTASGGSGAVDSGMWERRHREAAPSELEHGQEPRVSRAGQARRGEPDPGGHVRHPSRPRECGPGDLPTDLLYGR